jgi:hypothetical protein
VKVRTDLVATAGLDSVALSATSLNNRVSAFSRNSKTAEGIYLEQVGTLLGVTCKIILSASCPCHKSGSYCVHKVAIETRKDMYNPPPQDTAPDHSILGFEVVVSTAAAQG